MLGKTVDIHSGHDVVRVRGGGRACGLHVEEVENVVYVQIGGGAKQVED